MIEFVLLLLFFQLSKLFGKFSFAILATPKENKTSLLSLRCGIIGNDAYAIYLIIMIIIRIIKRDEKGRGNNLYNVESISGGRKSKETNGMDVLW